MSIRTLHRQFVGWYNRKLAILKLRAHNEYMLEMENILENWITEALLDGEMSPQEVSNQRSELLRKQYGIKRIESFLEYLDRIK